MAIKYFMDYIRENLEKYNAMVEKLMYDLEEKYPVTLFLHYNKFAKTIILSQIIIDKNERGKGIGSKVLQEICDFADENGLPIGLTPSSDFGGNVQRLKKFYKHFGFVKYKGYRFRETLIREPEENL